MYQARGYIQERTGKPLDDQYFTQTLQPDYAAETSVDWDIVYDARGHFHEPHTHRAVALGTVDVRDYLSGTHAPNLSEIALRFPSVRTQGHLGRFGATGVRLLTLQAGLRICEAYGVTLDWLYRGDMSGL
jgi:hypothetical protein